MNEREQKRMRVIMHAAIELIATYNSDLSEEAIRARMVRIATDLVENTTEEIGNER
jgi:hypothetical protein